jgi:phosphonoacetaldehyde hydrolase
MKLSGVIFDWAGTLVDHGSRAPVAALLNVFAAADVPVTEAEARVSMGIAKRDHIRALLNLPRVAAAWRIKHGTVPGEADADALYADFLPKQLECLGRFSAAIEGVPATFEVLRSRGIAIGSTTGYTRAMLDFLVERAREQGFAPDCAICPGDVPGGGRPAPWMCYLNAIRLRISPMWSMVKIGDTPSDIEEGLNAGMWTVGVTRTGNETGERLLTAGAHYLVDSAGDCMDTIDEIAARITSGERP